MTTCNFLNVTGANIGTYCQKPGVYINGKKIRCEDCKDKTWPQETYTCSHIKTRGANSGQLCGKNTKFSDSKCSVCRHLACEIDNVRKPIIENSVVVAAISKKGIQKETYDEVDLRNSIVSKKGIQKRKYSDDDDNDDVDLRKGDMFAPRAAQKGVPDALTLDYLTTLKKNAHIIPKHTPFFVPKFSQHAPVSVATSTSTPVYDVAVYDVGMSICWFFIRCKDVVAQFNMNLESAYIWKFFELIDSDKLFPFVNSGMKFGFGKDKEHNIPRMGNLLPLEPLDFLWLENFLKRYNTNCNDLGVEFFEALEDERCVDRYGQLENNLDQYDYTNDLEKITMLRRELLFSEC